MDLGWQEQQRAFQARVMTDAEQRVGQFPYRTFIGSPAPAGRPGVGRPERVIVVVAAGVSTVALLLGVGAARELAALAASFTGGVALMAGVAPAPARPGRDEWVPLVAIYPDGVQRGGRPLCITEISLEELDRLGVEGFGTVVGRPLPGATFGLFVDEHLVWPRTPPRPPDPDDPGFGTS